MRNSSSSPSCAQLCRDGARTPECRERSASAGSAAPLRASSPPADTVPAHAPVTPPPLPPPLPPSLPPPLPSPLPPPLPSPLPLPAA
eukprot:4734305-Prymnesium_polylepis.1